MAKASGDHAAVLKSGRWKEAVQAYLAAISHLDGQVGRVLDALEQWPYKDNTIICLWGDHGWHLGEKEHWRKFALWEEATRAPLIWLAPGTTTPGGVCKSPVDFMAIYPTLCDLADIPIPRHVEGQSIRGLLKDPYAASSGVGSSGNFVALPWSFLGVRWRRLPGWKHSLPTMRVCSESMSPNEWNLSISGSKSGVSRFVSGMSVLAYRAPNAAMPAVSPTMLKSGGGGISTPCSSPRSSWPVSLAVAARSTA